MRSITFIQNFIIVYQFFSLCSFYSSFHTVFWHAHTSCILKTAAQRSIGCRIRTTGFYSNNDLFSNTCKLLCHPVPAGKHAGLSYFKYSSHELSLSFLVFCFWFPAFGILLFVPCDAPFNVLFSIKQLRRSLPRAKRRIALLYFNNSIQLRNGRQN